MTAWTLSHGEWMLRLRPPLPTVLLALHEAATKLAKAGSLAEAAERWRAAAATINREPLLALWFLVKSASTFSNARLWSEADATYDQAIGEASRRKETAIAGRLLRDWAGSFQRRGEWDRAEDCYRRAMVQVGDGGDETIVLAGLLVGLGSVKLARGDLAAADALHARALAIDEKLSPGSLNTAAVLNNLGIIKNDRGELDAADELYRRALSVKERLAPGSLEVASTLNNLGATAYDRGNLPEAQTYFERSREIRERLDPGGLPAAEALGNLGAVADARGDLGAAEEYHRRALLIRETLQPSSLAVASVLNNLGLTTQGRGDFARAEECYRRSLSIAERLAPDTSDTYAPLHNLGKLALDMNDLDGAESVFRRTLTIAEKIAPGKLRTASALNGLGVVAERRRDFALAQDYFRRALEIRDRLAPNSLPLANVLLQLGTAALAQGDIAAGEAHVERALKLAEQLAPGGLDVAGSMLTLAEAANERRDVGRAKDFAQRSLDIAHRLAPGSLAEAEALHALGVADRAGGGPGAADTLCHAVDALESQKAKLGGTEEVRTAFGAKYVDYYRDCLEALAAKGEAAAAFGVLERSRARSLLSMLAERDLVFAADVPVELDRERKLTNADYDRAQGELAQLSPTKDLAQIQRLHARLAEVRARQDEIAASIRKASPRLAALQYPQPLGLDAARAALQPGTLLLSYSVGRERTILFVVRPSEPRDSDPGLTLLTLPIGEKDLRSRAEAFRDAIQSREAAAFKVLGVQGAALYDLLIKPAERLIAATDRVLISPDGPLHTLPFAALVRRETRPRRAGATSYLVEWKPLHQVISATVYSELTRSPREGSQAASLVAFGDPKYPAAVQKEPDEVADATLRSVARGGFTFEPLPSSRNEVEGIGRLYPQEASVYLGEAVTEERVKSTGKNVRYLHFATHGLLNERFPLDSALVLTIPEHSVEGQDNGLLQAWEVFEKLRIDADLVTLSACETGLGKEMGGEGLVGLTRAFQYAGARSVLASLWSVSDESTADLMKRFYTYLKAGKTKDEALRAAQVELIQGATAAHPFHWAAFQLVGDWR